MMIVITVFRFQPFGSRDDTVVGLRFRYDARLVGLLKALLRLERRRVPRWPVAGGWLPEYRCWFVEERVWPAIAVALQAAGYRLQPAADRLGAATRSEAE